MFVPLPVSMETNKAYVIAILSPLHVLIAALLLIEDEIIDSQGDFFKANVCHPGQRPILFGQLDLKHYNHPLFEIDDEVPNFSAYGPKVCYMMRRIGYKFRIKASLNFGNGRCVPLRPTVLGGREIDYYHIIGKELGYAITPKQS